MKPTTPRPLLIGVALAVSLALVASASADAPDGRAPRRPVVTTKKIAPGLFFTKIIQKRIPRRTFVLEIDPSRALTLDVMLTQNQLPANRTVSATARRVGALAAVNGDFGSERPIHPFAQDGDLVQTAGSGAALFALRVDEQDANLGIPEVNVSLTNRSTGVTWSVDRLNRGRPSAGEIAAFSPVGGSLESPPAFACSVRLLPQGEPQLGDVGVVRDYVVDTNGCFEEPLQRKGGVVLSAEPATDEATLLLAVVPGTEMRLRWSLGWENVYDAVGGMPILVQDGKIVVQPCSGSFCGRNPRTAIGWTGNGRVLLVVVDGRQRRSAGSSLLELARQMRSLGAVQALNLDGGGSSAMVVRDEVVNRPSDGRERPISNVVVVLPGQDPGES